MVINGMLDRCGFPDYAPTPVASVVYVDGCELQGDELACPLVLHSRVLNQWSSWE